jgi:hypothetical protein
MQVMKGVGRQREFKGSMFASREEVKKTVTTAACHSFPFINKYC